MSEIELPSSICGRKSRHTYDLFTKREGKQNSSGLFVYFSGIFLDCGKPQKSKQKCRTILMSHVGFRIIFRSWKGLQNNSLLTCVFYIRVYDLMFFDEVAKIEAHESEVLCVEFSPNESGMNVNPRDFILICGWSLCGNCSLSFHHAVSFSWQDTNYWHPLAEIDSFISLISWTTLSLFKHWMITQHQSRQSNLTVGENKFLLVSNLSRKVAFEWVFRLGNSILLTFLQKQSLLFVGFATIYLL